MKINISVLLILFICCGCAATNKDRVYKNSDFAFSIVYKPGTQATPIKWTKEETGVNLKNDNGVITVQAMAAGADYESMPFSDYVKISAISEIQNYEKLISLEGFTSDYGINGFRTFWEVVQHEDYDTGEVSSTLVIGPIYYFPPLRKQKLGAQPVKTIMISASKDDSQQLVELNEVARSFRYLNSFRSLFNKGAHGKISFVKKGEKFRIELPSNPTTGYNWYIDELDESFFKIASSGFIPPNSQLVGAGGMSYWELVPLKEGFSLIKL